MSAEEVLGRGGENKVDVAPDNNESKPEQPFEPETPQPLAGFQIQLEADGQVTRRIYGTEQNVSSFYGLVRIMDKEVEALASTMPGQTPTRDVRILSNVVTSITNMANVLMGIQSGLNQLTQRVEELANDKPEPELQDDPGEKVPSEGS